MVLALAFAELVFGGLLITSALTREPLGELLAKGLTSAGKEAAHGTLADASAVEPTPPGDVPTGRPGESFGSTPSGVARGAIKSAESFIGVKYKWGGTNEREGFDCSGLIQAVYAKVGVKLPRTAAEQYKATTDVSKSDPRSWQPGDLLFFSNGREVSHVGMYISPGVMLDAPHSGAKVGFQHFTNKVGSKWGSDTFVGIHRP